MTISKMPQYKIQTQHQSVAISMKLFNFLQVTQTDVPLIHAWLKAPHVAAWFHGQGLDNTLSSLEAFVNNKACLSSFWLAQHHPNTPMAVMISSEADSSDQHYQAIEFSGQEVITLDLFIGHTEFLGKGYGAQLIYHFFQQVFPKATDFVIDPEATNTRAIHVYQKLGFEIINEFIAPWHRVPHYLMHVSQKHLRAPSSKG